MTRRWDGEPETPRDERFFNERESGYKGRLDQDGYRVSDAEAQRLLDQAHRPT